MFPWHTEAALGDYWTLDANYYHYRERVLELETEVRQQKVPKLSICTLMSSHLDTLGRGAKLSWARLGQLHILG